MRAKRSHWISIYETFAKHEIGQELKTISEWLDRHVEVLLLTRRRVFGLSGVVVALPWRVFVNP